MIPKPYLLFLGDAKDDLAIKTAAGVSYWKPEWCIGQLSFSNAKATLNLPELSIEKAVKSGAKTLVIGVVNAGGVMPENWKQTLIEATKSGLNIASGMHTRLSSISEINSSLNLYFPLVGTSKHPIIFINVDFPEPEGPMIEM